MNTLPLDRIQVGRQCGDQGLALPRPHLGNPTFVEGHTTDHLHIEVPQAEPPFTYFSTDRKGIWKDFI